MQFWFCIFDRKYVELGIFREYGIASLPPPRSFAAARLYPGIFCFHSVPGTSGYFKKCSCALLKGQTTRSSCRLSPGENCIFRIENTMKNMRNENRIISSFRWISWHRSLMLRERSLMRGQLPSLLYLTWLSLPFQ